MIKKIIAAAAAVLIVFGGSISVYSLKNNDNTTKQNNTTTTETKKAVTNTDKTSDKTTGKPETSKSKATSVSTLSPKGTTITTAPQTTKVQSDSSKKYLPGQTASENNTPQTKAPENNVPDTTTQQDTSLNASFNTQDKLTAFVNSKAAENSPLLIGYKDAGYDKLYSELYNVNFTDTGYTCTIKNEEILRKCQTLLYPVYNKYIFTTEEATKKSLSNQELENYSRIIDYIDKTVGKDNYFIYDIYQSDINKDYKTCQYPRHTITDTNGKTNYYVEIVLKDYYEKYKKYNYRKDDFTVSFEICNSHSVTDGYCDDLGNPDRNEQSVDSLLISEYPLFCKSQKLFENFYNEFNQKYSDCAVGLGRAQYYPLSEYIDNPFISWIKRTDKSDETYDYNITPNYVQALKENQSDTLDSDYRLNIALYFKPGTDPAAVYSLIEEMKPVLKKYNVSLMTADVLNSEDDFNRYKESNGFIPDEFVNNALPSDDYYNRYYCMIDNNLENCWPGK